MRVRDAPRGADAPVRWAVLDAGAVSHVDATGLEALGAVTASLAAEGLR
jgi:anti-anti-sigma regulatory factor